MHTLYVRVEDITALSEHASKCAIRETDAPLECNNGVRLEFVSLAFTCICKSDANGELYKIKARTLPENLTSVKEYRLPIIQLPVGIIQNPKTFLNGETSIQGIPVDSDGMMLRLAVLVYHLILPYVHITDDSGYMHERNCGFQLETEDGIKLTSVVGMERPNLTYMQLDSENGNVIQKEGRFYADEFATPEENVWEYIGGADSFSATKTVKGLGADENVSIPVVGDEAIALRRISQLINHGKSLRLKSSLTFRIQEELLVNSLGPDGEDRALRLFVSTEDLINIPTYNCRMADICGCFKKVRLEIIDAPITAEMNFEIPVKTAVTLRTYLRNSIKIFSEVSSEVVVNNASDYLLKSGKALLSGTGDAGNIAWAVITGLCGMLAGLVDSKWIERHSVNNNSTTILKAELIDGNIRFRHIPGKFRPDLICKGLTGFEMFRPYSDEFGKDCLLSPENILQEAENGDAVALQVMIENSIYGCDNTASDYDASASWLEKAAEIGGIREQLDAGLCFMEGKHVRSDLSKALLWIGKAVDNGAEGWNSLLKSLQSALPAEKCHKNGNFQGTAALAEFYLNCTEANNTEYGMLLAEKAFRGGSEKGKILYAKCLSDGIGIPQNVEEAEKLLREAADSGNSEAMYELGQRALTGKFKGCDLGIYYIENAANNGFAYAMKLLGKLYETGNSIEADAEKAIFWYEKALSAMPEDKDLEFDLLMLKL